MNAGNSYVIEMLYPIAHEFGGSDRFFSYRDVAGAGGNYCDDPFTVAPAVAMKGYGSSFGTVDSLGNLDRYGVELRFCGARGQNVAFVLCQASENLPYLGGRLAFAEDNLGHALAERSVVVDFGETKVFKGKVAETSYRFVRGEFARSDIFEKAAKRGSVH